MGWILLCMLKYMSFLNLLWEINNCMIRFLVKYEKEICVQSLIQLALKDAEKVMNLRNNSVNPYILKASALILVSLLCPLFAVSCIDGALMRFLHSMYLISWINIQLLWIGSWKNMSWLEMLFFQAFKLILLGTLFWLWCIIFYLNSQGWIVQLCGSFKILML